MAPFSYNRLKRKERNMDILEEVYNDKPKFILRE